MGQYYHTWQKDTQYYHRGEKLNLFPFFSYFIIKIGVGLLTQEWMLKTLMDLGFKEVDAKVYLFLVSMGPQKGKDIADSLKLHKQQLYRSLKRLKNKRIVNSDEHPAVFSSISFEKVLDVFLEVKKEQADDLQENREELLSRWQDITKKDNSN
jgi:sugar-specific transcriptional regulator TrmB